MVSSRRQHRRLCSGKSVRNFGWMLLVYGFRAGSQAAYIVLLARALPIDGFGAFVACLATANLVAPFATWGSGYILIRATSRSNSDFPAAWGDALLVTSILGLMASVCIALAGHLWVAPAMSLTSWFAVVVAELVLSNIVQLSSQAFIAFDMHSGAARVSVALLICRLAGAAAFYFVFEDTGVEVWSWAYLVTSAVGSIVALVDVRASLGRAKYRLSLKTYGWREGFYFAIGLSAQSMTNDLDKTLLARLDTLGATAIYAAAYRVVGVALLPMLALLTTFFGRFFHVGGVSGIRGSRALALRILPFSAALGACCSLGLYLGAPVLPLLFGPGYRDSVEAVRLLALVPLLKSIQFLGADALSGADMQRIRTFIQIGAVVMNLCLVISLVGSLSWRGAALATLATELFLACAMWTAVFAIARRDRRSRHGLSVA
jgi:O-antigen/teichoic acid export membrane protein